MVGYSPWGHKELDVTELTNTMMSCVPMTESYRVILPLESPACHRLSLPRPPSNPTIIALPTVVFLHGSAFPRVSHPWDRTAHSLYRLASSI